MIGSLAADSEDTARVWEGQTTSERVGVEDSRAADDKDATKLRRDDSNERLTNGGMNAVVFGARGMKKQVVRMMLLNILF